MTAPPAAGAVLLAALAAGLAAVERKAALQVMISRPLVLGPLLGWTLGDPVGGFFVAAPLELLWSGTANLGAVLPQHETAGTIAIVAAAVAAGLAGGGVDAPLAFAAFLLLSPVALLGRALEGFAEVANERVASRAVAALAEGELVRGMRQHLIGLVWPFLGAAVMCAAAVLVAGPLLSSLRALLPADGRHALGFGWALLWAVGGAASVRAARLPRALSLAITGAVLVLAFVLAAGELF